MGCFRCTLKEIGAKVPDILIPKRGTDLSKWAVVACDQFTSQEDYWKKASQLVEKEPSALNIIFPECYLGKDDASRIEKINANMKKYVENNLFDEYPESLFLVKRECANGTVRWGIMLALDLDKYSWEKGSKTLIRATEGTILSRIPPRKAIRKDAPLELPHIMVLISDEKKSVIEPLAASTGSFRMAYNTPLMAGGGKLTAWAIDDEKVLTQFANALHAIYDKLDKNNPLLFAMGDGNHSFATAKSCWEDIKPSLTPEERENHPARYCLVEIENIFDPGLEFEPIHRVLFNTDKAKFEKALSQVCGSFKVSEVIPLEKVAEKIKDQSVQRFGFADKDGCRVYELTAPKASIPAGTLQFLIDDIISDGKTSVDYIHGAEVTKKLGEENGNVGLFLPAISKDTFFDAIVKDGALPRKTFSMGEAADKRYYMEARKIK